MLFILNPWLHSHCEYLLLWHAPGRNLPPAKNHWMPSTFGWTQSTSTIACLAGPVQTMLIPAASLPSVISCAAIAQGSDDHEDASLEAIFTFVARDPSTLKSMEINSLAPGTSNEQTWFKEREALAQQRRAARQASKASSGWHLCHS